MFDAPMDGLVLWVALGLVGATSVAIALGFPTVAAPDAGAVTDAVDRVATSPYEATETIRMRADAVRLGPAQVSLRLAGHTSHATFAAGPITPVGDAALSRVLHGARPSALFASRRAFTAALADRRSDPGQWREVPGRLRVRRVTWGDVDATLVG